MITVYIISGETRNPNHVERAYWRGNPLVQYGKLMWLTWFTNPRIHMFHIPQCSIQNRNGHISVLNGTNPRMHLFHIPQCSIQNRNGHISVLNGALWDMEQVHSGICEVGLLSMWRNRTQNIKKFIINTGLCAGLRRSPLTWCLEICECFLDYDIYFVSIALKVYLMQPADAVES